MRRTESPPAQFPFLRLNAGSAIIDGEVVFANGTTDLPDIAKRLKGRSKDIVLSAFDPLPFNGYDFRILPVFERTGEGRASFAIRSLRACGRIYDDDARYRFLRLDELV